MAKRPSGNKKLNPGPDLPSAPPPPPIAPVKAPATAKSASAVSLPGAASRKAGAAAEKAAVSPKAVAPALKPASSKKPATPPAKIDPPPAPVAKAAPAPKSAPKPAAKVPAPASKSAASAKTSAPPVRVKTTPSPPPTAPVPDSPRSAPGRLPRSVAPDLPSVSASSSEPKLKILFISSECAPYAKTGGLADAVQGLAKALQRQGHDVRISLPLYGFIDRAKFGITWSRQACIHMGAGEENWVSVQEAMLDGLVPVDFIEYERFFGRDGLYYGGGGDYLDNAYRFGLLCKAALQICKDTGWIPDVVHLHDWCAAPAAAFLKTWDRVLSPLSGTASVLTIHNVGHPGKYSPEVMKYYGLGPEYMHADSFEDWGAVNLLKAGIHFADAITTVSPTHAQEIVEPIGGQGLAPYLARRQNDLTGILNGVDTEHWDPATDKLIPARFSAEDMAGKAECKRALQERFHLEQNPHLPLFGIISRFAHQKGFDLLRHALPAALNNMRMQVVVLGSGDPDVENFFRWMSYSYGGRANAHIGYNNEISHWIEAGSDFFLMPSLYEPCGLNQIYSLKYGTLPIVRATGGLEDTVENYDEWTGGGTGFKFVQPTARALYDTIGWAVSTWFDRPHHIAQLRRNGMAKVFSWEAAATEYTRVYQHAIRNRRG